MVGVPRPQQGCQQCKRRRQRCDFQRPTCRLCTRLSLPCVYTERQYRFVNQDADAPWACNYVPPRGTEQLSSQHNLALSRTALEVRTIDEFWTRYLPRADPTTVQVDNALAASWRLPIQDLVSLGEPLTSALTACSFMVIGSADRNRDYMACGRQLYGRSLVQTNKALREPGRATSDVVLATCKILAVYENFRMDEGPTTQGLDWQRHVAGQCRIVELRGPEIRLSHNGHLLLEESRVGALISGIASRQPNYFSRSGWHMEPAAGTTLNLKNELLNYMATLPSILSRREAMNSRVSPDAMQVTENAFHAYEEEHRLLRDCLAVANSLRAWEYKAIFRRQESIGLANANANQDSSSQLKFRLWPDTVLDICTQHGYGFFHLCCLYWTACLVLHDTIMRTYQILSQLTADNRGVDAPGHGTLPALASWIGPRPFASNIAASAAHYFSPDAGLWGRQTATVSVGAAITFLKQLGEHESQDMRTLLDCLRKDPAASSFLLSMANSGRQKAADLPSESR